MHWARNPVSSNTGGSLTESRVYPYYSYYSALIDYLLCALTLPPPNTEEDNEASEREHVMGMVV